MALVRSMPIVAGVRTWQFAYTYGYEEDSYKMCLHSIRLSTSYTLPCQNVYYVDTPYLNHYLLHCLHMQSVFFYTRGDAEPANGQRSALPVMELSFLRTLPLHPHMLCASWASKTCCKVVKNGAMP